MRNAWASGLDVNPANGHLSPSSPLSSRCGGTGTKRCTGCYLVLFCSEDCFKKTWPAHKSACKETKAQFKTARLTNEYMTHLMNLRSNKVITKDSCSSPPVKKHFVVPIQVPQDVDGGQLLVYNEDRSVLGGLEREFNPQVVIAHF